MPVRSSFTAGEVLTAADLTDTFASKLDLAGGKILQIVRATDTTNRSTTSTSLVDVAGMSVTITPQESDSAVLILAVASFLASNSTNSNLKTNIVITDSSNNAISGAESDFLASESFAVNDYGLIGYPLVLVAYATPATTSPVTYKIRFSVADANNTATFKNATRTGQMYAIEVSA